MKTAASPVSYGLQAWPELVLVTRARVKGVRPLKRVTDIVLSSLLLIISAPVIAIAATLIRCDTRGPWLFKQIRVGRQGRLFTFYKLRTMRTDSDPKIHEQYVRQQLQCPDKSYQEIHKMKNDLRITRVGYWLRKTSIDELPQLWNVIKGDMSLVGPRPPIPYELSYYSPRQTRRLSILPGITGLWQVSGRSKYSYSEMIDLDLEYISRNSWSLDLLILLKTFAAILRIREAS